MYESFENYDYKSRKDYLAHQFEKYDSRKEELESEIGNLEKDLTRTEEDDMSQQKEDKILQKLSECESGMRVIGYRDTYYAEELLGELQKEPADSSSDEGADTTTANSWAPVDKIVSDPSTETESESANVENSDKEQPKSLDPSDLIEMPDSSEGDTLWHVDKDRAMEDEIFRRILADADSGGAADCGMETHTEEPEEDVINHEHVEDTDSDSPSKLRQDEMHEQYEKQFESDEEEDEASQEEPVDAPLDAQPEENPQIEPEEEPKEDTEEDHEEKSKKDVQHPYYDYER